MEPADISAGWAGRPLPLKAFLLRLSAVLLALLLSAPSLRSRRAEDFNPAQIRRAVFLPFVRILPGEEGRGVCPLDQAGFDSCRIEEAAEAELFRAIGRRLSESRGEVEWVPAEEIHAAQARLKAAGGEALSIAGPWQMALGRELQADAVLFGFIYCYRNRSGTAYASSRPAALGFCLHLVAPATGWELWSFIYADEQKALFDNLLEAPLFFKRRGRWITAEQMAEEAAEAVVKNLPWREGEAKGRKQ